MTRSAISLFLLAALAGSARAETQPPLYDVDTAAQPAPAPNSTIHKLLESLHVRVCVRADVAPFAQFTGGVLTGFDIALAGEIVDQISIDYKGALRPTWVIVTADERISRLQQDACDMMIGSFSYTAERAKQVATSQVYARTDKVLVGATKVTRRVPVIAKLEGATGDAGVAGTVRTFKTYQEIVFAMDQQEIDYLATDRPIAEYLMRSTIKSYAIKKTLTAASESYVIGVKLGNTAMLAAVDRALEAIARTGRLALLERRWL